MRSKHLSSVALTSLFLLLITSYASAASAVLGIDIGQEYIKAALVKPGIPLEIVLTKDTKRKEASAIGFKPANTPTSDGSFTFPERLYGADAINLASRFPGDVYPNLKQLLGKSAAHPAVATYSARYPALQITSSAEQGAVAFRSKSSPGAGVFTLEELLAMQLKAVVAQAQAMASPSDSRIRDVVFTVPAFFLAEEKYAITLAAELAGLRVMGYVTEGLAVGINYATSRTFDEKTPEYHIVYDMGAGSTTASVLKFQAKSVKDVGRFNKTVQEVTVLGVGYDRTLGGDLFNEKMVDLLAADFVASKKGARALADKEDPKKALRTNGRAAAKLWREATRSRQILSANTETVASVESLYEEIDFRSGKLTRAAFEAAIQEYGSRITDPIFDALVGAKISLDQVKSIILHGGAVRTPFVGKKLEETVGGADRISKNVNSDEAAVFGAVFKGAGESGSFKVKEIRTYDINPYAVSIRYLKADTAEKQTIQQIFPAGSLTGKDKIVGFPQKHDFGFEILHKVPYIVGGEELALIKTTNVSESIKKLSTDHACAEADITAKFTLTIDKKNGIPAVTKGWVECEVEVEEKKSIVDGVKKAFGFGKDKDSSSTTTASSGTSTTSTDSTTTTAPAETPTLVKKTQRVPVSFTITKLGTPPLSATYKQNLIAEIKSFDTHDSVKRATEDARNELETFTYKARERLSDDSFIAASTQDVRTQLSALLDDAADWLYGDGFHAVLADVRAKLSALKALETPVLKRKEEHEKRPEKVKLLRDAIDQGVKLLDVLSAPKSELEQLEEEPVEQVFTPEEIDELRKGYDATVSWLDGLLAEQDKKELFEDPVLTAKDVDKKLAEVNKVAMEAVQRKVRAATAAANAKKEKERKQKEEKKKLEKERKVQEKKDQEKKEGQEKKKEDQEKEEIKDEL